MALTPPGRRYLFGNEIRTLVNGTFADPGASLVELQLQQNRIDFVGNGTFESLTALTVLELGDQRSGLNCTVQRLKPPVAYTCGCPERSVCCELLDGHCVDGTDPAVKEWHENLLVAGICGAVVILVVILSTVLSKRCPARGSKAQGGEATPLVRTEQ